MTTEDVEYYRQRVAAELQLASAAERADVACIHEELARQYQALIDRKELRPAPPVVGASN